MHENRSPEDVQCEHDVCSYCEHDVSRAPHDEVHRERARVHVKKPKLDTPIKTKEKKSYDVNPTPQSWSSLERVASKLIASIR